MTSIITSFKATANVIAVVEIVMGSIMGEKKL